MASTDDNRTTRRDFLKHTAVLAGVAVGLSGRRAIAQAPASQPSLTTAPTPSRVVELFNEHACVGTKLHPSMVREMLDTGLCSLTDSLTPAEAWRQILRDDDVVAVKFNQVGASEIGTSEGFARILTDSLVDAEFDPQRIMLIEVARDAAGHATRPPPVGWTPHQVDFGSGKDQLASALDQATAIINVPFLKTHNIAGMSGCLKNLSHAFVRHPARYHGNGCNPYVADIVALPEIRDKLRLNLINALRIVTDNGPQARQRDIVAARRLILSRDPVAADTVGQDLLDARRLERNLPRLADDAGKLPILVTAARRGLGMNDPDALDHVKLTV